MTIKDNFGNEYPTFRAQVADALAGAPPGFSANPPAEVSQQLAHAIMQRDHYRERWQTQLAISQRLSDERVKIFDGLRDRGFDLSPRAEITIREELREVLDDMKETAQPESPMKKLDVVIMAAVLFSILMFGIWASLILPNQLSSRSVQAQRAECYNKGGKWVRVEGKSGCYKLEELP